MDKILKNRMLNIVKSIFYFPRTDFLEVIKRQIFCYNNSYSSVIYMVAKFISYNNYPH